MSFMDVARFVFAIHCVKFFVKRLLLILIWKCFVLSSQNILKDNL